MHTDRHGCFKAILDSVFIRLHPWFNSSALKPNASSGRATPSHLPTVGKNVAGFSNHWKFFPRGHGWARFNRVGRKKSQKGATGFRNVPPTRDNSL